MTVQPMFGLRQLIEESIGKPGLASTHRTHIARAVIVLAAGGGSRAVTHSAVDRHLGLPKGSTFYYCRTRAELVKPSIDLMRATSRASFIDFMSTAGPSITEVTRDYVLYLTTSRSCEVRARLALVAELAPESLRGMFFSHSSALEFFTSAGCANPSTVAAGFADLLEGLLLRTVFDPEQSLGADESPPSSARICRAQASITEHWPTGHLSAASPSSSSSAAPMHSRVARTRKI